MEQSDEVPRDTECLSPAFVFQDSASEVSSDYQAGSEASSSVRRILTNCTDPSTTRRRSTPGSSIPSTIIPPCSAAPQVHNNYKYGRHHRSHSFPSRRSRNNHLSPSSGDVSSITSNSMTSAYTSSEGESSVTSPKPLDRHFKRHRNVAGDGSDTEISNLTTTSSESDAVPDSFGLLGRLLTNSSKSLSTPRKSKPPSEATIVPNSWALSPSISSIPEEQGEDRAPKGKRDSYKEVISPVMAVVSNCSLPSPQSTKSLENSSNHGNMDTSSVAMESTSGLQSEATGLHSETTQVVRNTSGVPRPPKNDIERGAIPINLPAQPPLSLIPSGRVLEDTEPQSPYHDEKKKRSFSSKRSLCKGTQGWIICLLVALFVFGLITVVVSFVLSQKGGSNSVDSATTMVDDSGDDGLFDHSSPASDDESLLFLGDNITSTASTNAPSSNPTVAASFDEENALFADAVEELLTGSVSTYHPTLSPTAPSPSLSPTSGPPSRRPTQPPTTTTPTAAPTETLPLLYPSRAFTQEIQVWGQTSGDAAGSSTVLSGDGRILLVGSPNAGLDTLERTGQVNIYERKAVNTNTRQSNNIEWQWTLRTILQGLEALNQLGFSMATNHDGSIVAVSEPTANTRRGQVTIFEWQDGDQTYAARQVIRGSEASDHFGIALSLSNDGGRVAIGSPYHSTEAKPGQQASNLRGQVQVYEFSEETDEWGIMNTVSDDTLLGSSSLDWFGWAVSLSKDGQVLAVGAPRNTEFGGYVQCFGYEGNKWKNMGPPIMNVIPPVKLDDRFGHAISVTTIGTSPDSSEQVTRVAVGAPWKDVGNTLNSGMVAIYEWSSLTSTWSLDTSGVRRSVITEAEPGFYHQLGYSMSMDGDAIAVGVPGWDNRRGMVNLYWQTHAFDDDSASDTTWVGLANPFVGEALGDDFGFSVCLTVVQTEEAPIEPSSVFVAAGAIMVSAENASEVTGYSKVYQTGETSSR